MITIQTVNDTVDGRKNLFLQFQHFMHISSRLANSLSFSSGAQTRETSPLLPYWRILQ